MGQSLVDKRARKICELMEELDEAKEIIEKFVWPPDATPEQRRKFEQRAAYFAGCAVPSLPDEAHTQPETPQTKSESE